ARIVTRHACFSESSFLNFHDSDCEPRGSLPCDSLLSLNTEKILSQAKSIAEQKRFPFATDNDSTNEELAIAYVLIGSGLYDEAIRHFSTMLQEEPDLVSAIYGRGIAYGKKGLHDIKNAELALFELSRVIALEPDRPEVFEQRAEVSVVFFSLCPSQISSDYATAHEDFQQSLALNRNQPIAMLYKGLTFFHRGLLKLPLRRELRPHCPGRHSLTVSSAAMGLAALEVMQAVQRTWTSSKVRMNGKTRLMQWRDMFDIAVKWRRIADPDQPVLWLDQMPARSLSRGFNNHINLIRGQVINMRYLEYFEKILHFIKDRILIYHGANNPKGLLEVREALEKVHKVEDLLPIMKFNTKTKDGFTVNTKVPSLKDQGKEYDGFTITITGDKVGNILFSVETQTTEERTQLYHAEIDALYKDLTAKGKVLILSSEFGEADAVCNLILSLVYYFYNLMPLSRGSSVIAYSVIVGVLMASGKEVAGKIPKGKLVDFEAMTAPGSEAFSKVAKSWMNLKSISPAYKALPSVSETFPTLRSMIEVLNADSSPRCLQQL
ncbi:tetratricopeptide repeat protein 13-like, partial [Myotis lucifugus]|uniref:tetratricopeptide repeat protein 13-like n=1 Tax=Myotis lucifugus TaxID=59463 RepID=UPI000CCC4804